MTDDDDDDDDCDDNEPRSPSLLFPTLFLVVCRDLTCISTTFIEKTFQPVGIPYLCPRYIVHSCFRKREKHQSQQPQYGKHDTVWTEKALMAKIKNSYSKVLVHYISLFQAETAAEHMRWRDRYSGENVDKVFYIR